MTALALRPTSSLSVLGAAWAAFGNWLDDITERRVQRGALAFEAASPGSVARINPVDMRVAGQTTCPAAQTFGTVSAAPPAIRNHLGAHGCRITFADPTGRRAEKFWRKEIATRHTRQTETA